MSPWSIKLYLPVKKSHLLPHFMSDRVQDFELRLVIAELDFQTLTAWIRSKKTGFPCENAYIDVKCIFSSVILEFGSERPSRMSIPNESDQIRPKRNKMQQLNN
jgi:hypothetical protein